MQSGAKKPSSNDKIGNSGYLKPENAIGFVAAVADQEKPEKEILIRQIGSTMKDQKTSTNSRKQSSQVAEGEPDSIEIEVFIETCESC